MTSEVQFTLRDFVQLQRGTTYKGNLLGLPGPVLLGLASIQPNGGFRRGSFKTYGGESPEKITLKSGEIYVSLKDVTQSGDLLGSVSRVPVDIKLGRLTQDTVKLDFQGKPISNSYIYWLLRTPFYREYCRARGTGTTTLGLGRNDFLDFPVQEPTDTELSLVELLEAVDDRITLLREASTTLEAIAQALFKSWFVDFDPVRAKQQGREPEGMDSATAALFPDSFDESELGLIPMGWRIGILADTFEINPTRKLKKGAIAPYLDMASLATSGHCVEAPIQREMGSGAKFRNGDTLLARITPCLENGKSAFVDFLADGQIGWGSTEFLVLRPKKPLPEYFGYLLCRHPLFREYAIQSMSGTSGRQRIQNDALGRYALALPDSKVALAFSGVVESIQESISTNHETAQTLAALRDTLLPRLISGQLGLPEAASLLEKAAA
jgi:type I restriction enzyme S subunit